MSIFIYSAKKTKTKKRKEKEKDKEKKKRDIPYNNRKILSFHLITNKCLIKLYVYR